MAPRIPRGYAEYHKPVQEIMEGQRPSLAALGNLLPAPWLPVYRIDKVHDDALVIPAGTIVGRINATDHANAYAAVTASLRTSFLVPANAGTGEYTVTYSQNDIDYLIPDADAYPTVVAATGASDLSIEAVKPLGIATQDLYASHMSATWTNYERQHMVTFLSYGYVIMVPVMTASEASLQIGDLVQVEDQDDANSTWRPASYLNSVGRYKLWESGDNPEFKVGRVLEKIALATQTSSVASQQLDAAIAASNVTTSTVHDFSGLGKVQTVPGLGLTGSGTLGIPASMMKAVPQSQIYSALLISISCV